MEDDHSSYYPAKIQNRATSYRALSSCETHLPPRRPASSFRFISYSVCVDQKGEQTWGMNHGPLKRYSLSEASCLNFFSSNWRIKIEIMRQKVPYSWYQNDDRRMVYNQFLPFSRAQSFTLLSMGGSTCSFPEQRLVIEPIYDPITLVINLSSSWSRKLATESVSKLTFRALALRHKPIRSDKGLTLETSALNLFTVANSHYQISC